MTGVALLEAAVIVWLAVSLLLSRREAGRDPLTGLANRRAADAWFGRMLRRRYNGRLTAVVLDMDHVKQYNDTRGHQAGDQLLRSVARVLGENARKTDLAVRWGGEEFLLMLPRTNEAEAEHLVERMRKVIRQNTGATFSAGIAEGLADKPVHDILHHADTALYQAKVRRDCTVRWVAA